MDALTALKTRRCVRKFTSDPVTEADLYELIDCAHLAASARNLQPIEYVAVQDAALRRELAAATGDNGKSIAEAPLCVAVVSRESRYYVEDGSAATQNLLVAARALGLAGCWVAGDKKPYAEKIGEILGLPKDVRLVSLVPIGRPAEEPHPPKRALREVLHRERFGSK